jgi:hypothetical protein
MLVIDHLEKLSVRVAMLAVIIGEITLITLCYSFGFADYLKIIVIALSVPFAYYAY